MKAEAILTWLLVLSIFSSAACSVQQESAQLFIQVSIEVSESVMISGRVIDMKGNTISEAVVSIQVVDPLGSTIHIARALSAPNGSFSDTFALNPRIPVGTYTVYITASKEGYIDGRYATSFLIARRDFMITITESVKVMEQGENATYNMNVIGTGIFNETVYLTLGSALPQGIRWHFSSDFVQPNASLILTLVSSPDTPTGNYTLLILGSGGGRSRSASATLVIVAKQTFAPLLWLISVASALTIGYVMLRRKSRRIMRFEELELTKEDVIATRKLVELEQLRAEGKIDEKEYLRLRRECEKKIERKS